MTKEKKKSSKKNKSSELLAKKEDEKRSVECKVERFLTVFFSPLNPHYSAAWNELYYMYLEEFKDKDSPFFKEIQILENRLAHARGMETVFLLFKKIVPTIDPSDFSPLKLLQDSIADIEKYKDYNKLFVFVQIATLKLKELEERVRKNGVNNKLLKERKKYEEIEILHPLFSSILESGEGYTKGYHNIIIPEIVEHKDYLFKTIDNCIRKIKKKDKKGKSNKKKKDNYINCFKKIRNLYTRLENYQERIEEKEKTKNTKDQNKENDKNETIDNTKKEIRINLRKIDILEKNYYHNKFYDWKKKNNGKTSKIITISYARVLCSAQYVEKNFWSPLPPWPINDFLSANYMQERAKSLMDDDEMWSISPYLIT